MALSSAPKVWSDGACVPWPPLRDSASLAVHQAALIECVNKATKASSRDVYMMELALQRHFEGCVVSEPLLHAGAVAAYQV